MATLTFAEAARGVKDYYIDLLVRAICPKCRGGKSELGYTWQVCCCNLLIKFMASYLRQRYLAWGKSRM